MSITEDILNDFSKTIASTEIVKALTNDYFIDRFMQKVNNNATKELILETAEDVLGEMRAQALVYAVGQVRYEATKEFLDKQSSAYFSSIILKSQPFMFAMEVWDMMLELSLPDDYIHDVGMPSNAMYITWPVEKHFDAFAVASMVLIQNDYNGFDIVENKVANSGGHYTNYYRVKDVWTTPYKNLHAHIKCFVNLFVYINNPDVADKHNMKLRHSSEKRARRNKLQTPVVNVVRLPAYLQKSASKATGKGEKINCRFLVRGHYRNQWYPSEGTHKLKWIKPFVKGSEDKPFKEKVYKL